MLDLPNGYRFFIFDNPLEQGRCQIHLIFDMENRNLLKLITKNLFSTLGGNGCRDQPWVRVGRNDPDWTVDPGKKVSGTFDTSQAFLDDRHGRPGFLNNRTTWQPSCILWSG
jgi:hypothetical protein